ncbi:MAG: cytochrome P450, partial [Proteobacteria bacterium]
AEQLAGRLPLRVISSLLGIPEQDEERLSSLSQRMFAQAGANADVQRTRMEVATQLKAYGRELGRERRGHPTGDIVSVLVHTEVDGQRLDDDQFEAFFMLLFNAGAETTRSLLCHLLQALSTAPELAHALRRDHTALPLAIEECARLESPVVQLRRTATRDTLLHEQGIRAGDKVVVLLASANRDETVFTDADTFDPRRTPNPHLSFGVGAHFCLGAHIARMQIRLAMQAVLQRFARIECGPIRYEGSSFVRSVVSMPVTVWS